MEIITCKSCGGTGKITDTIYHNNSTTKMCTSCRGTGKIVNVSINTSIDFPFSEKMMSEFLKFSGSVNSEIVEMRRRILKISEEYNGKR